MARDADRYRSMGTGELLMIAREEGIDADMAIVLAERLDILENVRWRLKTSHESMGGRYKFIHRSETT
jgi:hypothetical protein